jgi:predicted amidophosphoribosyltransferase
MKVSVKSIQGVWDDGLVLDKHTVSSTYLGDDENGRPQFDTVRTDIGEAMFQLKYRNDWSKVDPLADLIVQHGVPEVRPVNVVVPMPASHARTRQPVTEIARRVARLLGLPCDEALLSKTATPQLKNLNTLAEKEAVLADAFSTRKQSVGPLDVLLIDDLFHTGASMTAACTALRSHPAVRRIGVVALTWR